MGFSLKTIQLLGYFHFRKPPCYSEFPLKPIKSPFYPHRLLVVSPWKLSKKIPGYQYGDSPGFLRLSLEAECSQLWGDVISKAWGHLDDWNPVHDPNWWVFDGDLWFSVVFYGFLWFSMVFYGFLWFSMVSYGFPWVYMGLYGFIWVYMVFNS